jgi:endonuclease VIII
MEGPSLVILKEELSAFAHKKITAASGLSRIDYQQIIGQKIKAFKSWGKHFLIEFNTFSIRIHFLMFGSYRVNERKETKPRLHLQFEDGQEINFYTTAVIIINEPLDDVYDWSADVMNDEWDAAKARRKLKKSPLLNVGDALLDQSIFSGVGNIIKNEVLFRIEVHPNSVVGELPPRKLTALIEEARQYSFDFYNWKKIYQLKKHWLIYTKKKCPRCKGPALKEYTGKTQRRSFFCVQCQVLYAPVMKRKSAPLKNKIIKKKVV